MFNPTGIIKKEEHVLFLKTKLTGHDATLTITASRLYLEAEDSGVFIRGIVSFLPFLRSKLQKIKPVFDMDVNSIQSVNQGK